MKKRKTANLIMVLMIIGIVLTGLFCVGMIQGKFDSDDGTKAVLSDIRGIINLKRDGVILTLREDTLLREGDVLTNYPGATARVQIGKTLITLGDQAELEIKKPNTDGFYAVAKAGEFFVDAVQSIELGFEDHIIQLENSVCHASIRTGAQSISVLSGTVEDATAGQIINWFGGEKQVTDLSIQSLNSFLMDQIRLTNRTKQLCFSNQDLDQLQALRMAEKQELLKAAKETEPEEITEVTMESALTEETTDVTTVPSEPQETTEATTAPTEPEETAEATIAPTEPEETTEATTAPTEPEETTEATTAPTEPEATTESTTEPTEPANSCTITIRCDTILDNFGMLDPAKAGYVPSNGVILDAVNVEFEEGETVFDVLNRVCEVYEIPLEYSWTPLYDSYYIEGINNIYEFDCGGESGWMYKVNGWFPNYGCSSYVLQDGDGIVWCYTCIGLGLDVGGSNW